MGNCCSSPKAEDSEKHEVKQAGTGAKEDRAGRENLKTLSSKGPRGFDGLKGTHQAVRLLGRGAAADTWLFRDFKRRKLVAIKLFQRPIDKCMKSNVQREIEVQSELGPGHMNLINVYEIILTPTHLGLVMEAALGGALTTYVGDRWQHAKPHGLILQEDEALYFFRQFISAVDYCHKHGIAHRDLKLDNALLDESQPPVLKICDFGFARHFEAGLEGLKRCNSHLGTQLPSHHCTPEYMSPELLHNNINTQGSSKAPEAYDPRETDVWASGVMLVVAMLGAFPFDHTEQHAPGTSDDELDLWLQEVNKGWSESQFISANVSSLSSDVRDLLDRIFVVDPAKRITVEQIKLHPWYTQKLPDQYEQALARLAKQQRELDDYAQKTRPIDQEKVGRRRSELEQMIEEATSSGKQSRFSTHLRPLHTIDFHHEDLTRLDLSDAAVREGSEESLPTTNSDVVLDRFNSGSKHGDREA